MTTKRKVNGRTIAVSDQAAKAAITSVKANTTGSGMKRPARAREDEHAVKERRLAEIERLGIALAREQADRRAVERAWKEAERNLERTTTALMVVSKLLGSEADGHSYYRAESFARADLRDDLPF